MAPGPDEQATPGTPGFDELRALIIGEERARIEALEARSSVPTAKDVAEVLPEAVLRASRDDQFAQALAPTVEAGLEASARKNPKVLAEAIYPILGPAIRRSIQATLAAAIESFNTTLEHSFSPRSLRWRIEAWRTGKSFAEVVLVKSLVFRVEQVFLIHRATGVLLEEVSLPAAGAADPDLISAMLTAIQSFVIDSFGADGEDEQELRQIEVSGRRLSLVQGPHAVLAAVVRGQPPAALHQRLQVAIETIHLERAEDLSQFDGDTAPFELARGDLEECLVEERKQEEGARKKANPLRLVLSAGAIVVAVFAVIWGLRRFESGRAFGYVHEALLAEPGIVLLDVERDGHGFYVRGLRDPLAREPEEIVDSNRLRKANVEFEWELMLSFDAELALPRALAVLAPPADTGLTLEDGVLHARGRADSSWAARAAILAATLPGIVRYDDTQLELLETQD